MRLTYIVTYDVREARRLRQIFKTMRGFGDHLQYSVFRCDLNAKDRVRMVSALTDVIKHDEDQVLIIPLGPPDGPRTRSIQSIGQPYVPADHDAIIV